MTKRYISPQGGPVDFKTDKDSHYHSQEHTKPAGVQNEAYTPTTEEVRSQYQERGNLGWLLNVAPYNFDKQAMRDEFDRWLRTVKADAWEEGVAAVEAYGMSIANYEQDEELLVNPYEREES